MRQIILNPMKHKKPFFTPARSMHGFVLALGLIGLLPNVHAQIVWTGPNTNYNESPVATFSSPNGGGADLIIGPTGTNKGVSLTRSFDEVLYNRAAGETTANGSTSPVDTMWAFGSLANFASLSYKTLTAIRNSAVPDFQAAILNKPMVVHLVNENIYLSLTFTSWPQHDAGGFAYTRSTAPAAVPPTVSITNPVSGAVFAAPANVKMSANASVSSGSVTNVSFRQGTTVLGSVTSAPFNFTAPGLSAGSYSLTAVATANGLSATSAVVTVSVINPVAITLSSPQISNGNFIFSYSADPGLSYVVQDSSDLSTWIPLGTNVATSNPVTVTNPVLPGGNRYFRVGRLPNP